MSKNKVEVKKLRDYLEQDDSQVTMDLHLKMCKNNTEKEVILLEGEIHKMELNLNQLYKQEADTFSGSKIYDELKRLELAKMKLDGLQKLIVDLF